ncbi:hypothetical protein BC828DRAFT_383781 [Blastocladiella britannica]|nr:hypothetical protein BC828DRAFT_383781 [Blastocladiella britannica]
MLASLLRPQRPPFGGVLLGNWSCRLASSKAKTQKRPAKPKQRYDPSPLDLAVEACALGPVPTAVVTRSVAAAAVSSPIPPPAVPLSPPQIATPLREEHTLHHLVMTPRRIPTAEELAAGSYFLQSSIPRMVYSHYNPEKLAPDLGGLPEIAFMGPSNAGKSSLLNVLVTRLNVKIAKTSKKPGSTKTINFYKFGNRFTAVDMMGYGIGSQRDWGGSIEGYLRKRKELKHVYWLIPSHEPIPHDFDLAIRDLLKQLRIPHTIVLTQIDRIPTTQFFLQQLDAAHRHLTDPALNATCEGIICTSSEKWFMPQWNAARLGGGSVAQVGAKSPTQMPGGAGPLQLGGLGWATSLKAQVKIKNDVLVLNKPGLAELQHHIMVKVGANKDKWMIKSKKVSTRTALRHISELATTGKISG